MSTEHYTLPAILSIYFLNFKFFKMKPVFSCRPAMLILFCWPWLSVSRRILTPNRSGQYLGAHHRVQEGCN